MCTSWARKRLWTPQVLGRPHESSSIYGEQRNEIYDRTCVYTYSLGLCHRFAAVEMTEWSPFRWWCILSHKRSLIKWSSLATPQIELRKVRLFQTSILIFVIRLRVVGVPNIHIIAALRYRTMRQTKCLGDFVGSVSCRWGNLSLGTSMQIVFFSLNELHHLWRLPGTHNWIEYLIQ